MVTHVKPIGIMMIISGVIWCLAGILYAAIGPLFLAMMLSSGGRNGPTADDKTAGAIITVVCIVIGLFILVIGALNIYAGVRCLSFKNRVLVIISLFGNLGTLLTCSILTCLPILFSLVLLVYGLIVLFNSDVARAFQMAESGETPDEIRDYFARGIRGDRWQEN